MKNSRGFTMVELIVTITILVILATISYIYFTGNLSKSRDSARVSDIETMQKGVELFKVGKESYPYPDTPVNITYTGSTLWIQGVFGSGVAQKVNGLGRNGPTDPYYGVSYSYSITPDNSSYQIGGIFENGDSGYNITSSVFSQATAANGTEIAYLIGNYNGLIVKTIKNGILYIIATPSITATDISDTNALNIFSTKKLVYNGYQNLPNTYAKSLNVNGGFNFSISQPVIFSGSQSSVNLVALDSAIKTAYTGTILSGNQRYKNYLTSSGSVDTLKSIFSKNFKISIQ